MIFLILGIATLLAMMAALGLFSRAQIATVKQFGVWIVALGGLILAALLFLTGRGVTAIAALALLGPMVWSWMPQGRSNPGSPGRSARTPNVPMTREDAYAVLGLQPGASQQEIQASYIRLMRAAHPDRGGSDWLAARVNQARDVLLA